jgi:hypothetical protein
MEFRLPKKDRAPQEVFLDDDDGEEAAHSANFVYRKFGYRQRRRKLNPLRQQTKAPGSAGEKDENASTSPSYTSTTTHPPGNYTILGGSRSKKSKSSKSSKQSKSATQAPIITSPTATPSPTSSYSKSTKSSKSSKSAKKNPTSPPNAPDDHYGDSCVKSYDGMSIVCNSSTDFGLNGEWITLASVLACPKYIVDKYGFVDSSQRLNGMCSCSATLTTYLWYILDIVDTVTPIECGCFACAAETHLGQRSAFGYRELEMPVLDASCLGFDCEGRCNADQDTALSPIIIDDDDTTTPPPVDDPILIPVPTSSPTGPGFSGPLPPVGRPTPVPGASPSEPSPAPQQGSAPAGAGSTPGNVETNSSGAAFVSGSPSWLWIVTTLLLLFMGNRSTRTAR